MRDRTSSRTATISLIVIFILCSFLPVTAETAADPIDQPGIDAPPPIEVTAEVPAEPVVDATAEVQAEPVMEAG